MNVAKERILGYDVESSPASPIVESIAEWIGAGAGLRWLACINPHSYAVAEHQSEFKTALRAADWLIPDGVGIVMASRALGGSIKDRVTGSDIFEGLSRELNRMGGKGVFFLGATEDTLQAIREKYARDFPHVRIAGTFSPPFKPAYSESELDQMVALINDSGADVLWVGLTSPKQDLLIFAQSQRLKVKFAAGIGAVFDFYTGRVKRTPKVFRSLGLEWLPRLVQQPRRLWRRMGVSAPLFVFHVLRQRAQRR